jgi:hypothetical protein
MSDEQKDERESRIGKLDEADVEAHSKTGKVSKDSAPSSKEDEGDDVEAHFKAGHSD